MAETSSPRIQRFCNVTNQHRRVSKFLYVRQRKTWCLMCVRIVSRFATTVALFLLLNCGNNSSFLFNILYARFPGVCSILLSPFRVVCDFDPGDRAVRLCVFHFSRTVVIVTLAFWTGFRLFKVRCPRCPVVVTSEAVKRVHG